MDYPSRTSQYPFSDLGIGHYFSVDEHFQHARVAASEYGRRNGVVFSCRMQEDRTMRVYRVERNQASVDVRGRQGHRAIPQAVTLPSKQQFTGFLLTLKPGMSYKMPAQYSSAFELMQAWTELTALKTRIVLRSALQSDGTLLLSRGSQ